jgi:hypothetical protein
VGAVLILAGSTVLSAQFQLPSGPAKKFGASITGAFEGWYDNPDGSHTFLVGYYNRNTEETLDIPIGPNNQILPGGPDMGQPTHFLAGRQVGMFTIVVPKDFTPQQKLTWTLSANGETNQIPLRLNVDYVISPFSDVAVGNTPPVLKFAEAGPTVQGPIASLEKATAMTTSMATPLTLPVWANDDAKYSSGTNAPMREVPKPIRLTWTKYRGPGEVTFAEAKPEMEVLMGGEVNQPFAGKASTTAKFSEPGEYVLQLTANDFSGFGGGGEVCCWTTTMVKVTVTP